MINTDSKLITSVIGFNLKVTVKDENNQMVKTGIKHTIQRAEGSISAFKNRIGDKKWFTHFNDGLYNKVLDYRKNNY